MVPAEFFWWEELGLHIIWSMQLPHLWNFKLGSYYQSCSICRSNKYFNIFQFYIFLFIFRSNFETNVPAEIIKCCFSLYKQLLLLYWQDSNLSTYFHKYNITLLNNDLNLQIRCFKYSLISLGKEFLVW